MLKKFFAPFALVVALAACNSGQNKEKAPVDTVSTSSMDMDSTATDSVPPLPAIPATAKVFFKNLKNGQTVHSPLTVQFGQSGIILEPKGPVKDSSGHHHLLIDVPDVPAGTVIPDDSTHIHYGGAQTEASITLKPGKHTLILQYGDGIHRSYGPKLSATVSITVK